MLSSSRIHPKNENNSCIQFLHKGKLKLGRNSYLCDLSCPGQFFLQQLEIIGKTRRKFPSRKARLSPLLEHELACNRLNMPFHVERVKNANSFLPITVAVPPLINCTCFQVINNGPRNDTDSCDGLTNGESRVIDASPLPSLFFSFVYRLQRQGLYSRKEP